MTPTAVPAVLPPPAAPSRAASGTVVRELPAGSLAQWWDMVGLTLNNQFLSWSFFLPNFVIGLLEMITSAAIFFFMGQLVAAGAAPHIAEYGVGFGTYIVIGLLFNRMLGTTLTAFHEALLNSYWSNQLNTYFQYPGGISAYFTGNLLFKYVLALINLVIYLVVGIAWFGVKVSVETLPAALVILVVSVISVAGLGLVGASAFCLLNAKRWGSNPVEWFVSFAVTLVSGLYFPPTVLPQRLQDLGEWLPHTRALRAARLTLTGEAGLPDPTVVADVQYLLAFAAVTVPIGAFLYGWGIKRGLRDGTLVRWN